MSVRRLSISVAPEVEVQIRQAADRANLPVSVWLAQAAGQKARHDAAIADGLAAVAAFETEFGRIPPEADEWARRELAKAGIVAPFDQTAR